MAICNQLCPGNALEYVDWKVESLPKREPPEGAFLKRSERERAHSQERETQRVKALGLLNLSHTRALASY